MPLRPELDVLKSYGHALRTVDGPMDKTRRDPLGGHGHCGQRPFKGYQWYHLRRHTRSGAPTLGLLEPEPTGRDAGKHVVLRYGIPVKKSDHGP